MWGEWESWGRPTFRFFLVRTTSKDFAAARRSISSERRARQKHNRHQAVHYCFESTCSTSATKEGCRNFRSTRSEKQSLDKQFPLARSVKYPARENSFCIFISQRSNIPNPFTNNKHRHQGAEIDPSMRLRCRRIEFTGTRVHVASASCARRMHHHHLYSLTQAKAGGS